jgi:hypothetical protein
MQQAADGSSSLAQALEEYQQQTGLRPVLRLLEPSDGIMYSGGMP